MNCLKERQGSGNMSLKWQPVLNIKSLSYKSKLKYVLNYKGRDYFDKYNAICSAFSYIIFYALAYWREANMYIVTDVLEYIVTDVLEYIVTDVLEYIMTDVLQYIVTDAWEYIVIDLMCRRSLCFIQSFSDIVVFCGKRILAIFMPCNIVLFIVI